jgi:cell division protein FtsQ
MSDGRRKKYALLGLLMALLGLVVSSSFWKANLKVGRIVVEGNRIVEANEVLQLAHVEIGTAMNDLDLTTIQQHVASNFFIKDAVVERDLPATLRITVTERTPVAMLTSASILYLDEEGVILPHSVSREIFDLPLLSGWPTNAPLKAGTTVKHPDVLDALEILVAAKLVGKELYHLISEVHIRHGGDLVLYSAERGVPIIFGRGDAASKLVRLESFWNQIVRERGPQALQYVDLRYDGQIVVRWNPESTSSTKL